MLGFWVHKNRRACAVYFSRLLSNVRMQFWLEYILFVDIGLFVYNQDERSCFRGIHVHAKLQQNEKTVARGFLCSGKDDARGASLCKCEGGST